MNIELNNIYTTMCYTPSDINQHLPTLKRYALGCDHITEFGVRWVVSTWGLLAGLPKKMLSYDITDEHSLPYLPNIERVAKDNKIDFTFIVSDTRKITIEPTDLLFIDTLHIYEQLKLELQLHSSKVKKYIIMHDTATYAYSGEDGTQGVGLVDALDEFLENNSLWRRKEVFTNNNGLTIIERIKYPIEF